MSIEEVLYLPKASPRGAKCVSFKIVQIWSLDSIVFEIYDSQNNR